jgi:hypothetical protein
MLGGHGCLYIKQTCRKFGSVESLGLARPMVEIQGLRISTLSLDGIELLVRFNVVAFLLSRSTVTCQICASRRLPTVSFAMLSDEANKAGATLIPLREYDWCYNSASSFVGATNRLWRLDKCLLPLRVLGIDPSLGCAMLETGRLADFVVAEQETTRLPVRSALLKQRTGGLVVRWVTTSEYPLLYVFALLASSN